MKHYSRLLVTVGLAASMLLGMHPATDTALCAALPPSVSALPAITAEISTPVRLATDSVGNIYVTDPHSGGILKYNNALSTVQHIPTSKNGSGVAIAQNGDILVTQATYVAVIDKTSYLEKSRFGVNLAYANGIAVDASGNIYVSDGLNNNIQKYGVAYNYLLTSSITLSRPAGIQYEKASDRIVVANSLSGKIVFIKPDLTLDTTIGVSGSVGTYGYVANQASNTAPRFLYPQGIAFEYDGGGALYRIYVSDSVQNVVQVLDGTVATKLYLRNIGGDGLGFDASKLYKLSNPSDVLFEQSNTSNKRIFVANGGGGVTVFGCDNMQPTNIKVINPALSSLTVTWANPQTTGFNNVRIYRADAAGNPLTPLTPLKNALPGETSFIDTGLAEGTQYYYLVRAVDTLNSEYNNTQPVTAVTRKNYTLTLSSVPITISDRVGSGSINGDASSGVDTTSSVQILDNTLVNLTATPNALTSIFEGWTGACAVYEDNPTCQVTMTAAKSATASFRPQYPFYVDGYWLDTLQDAHWAADGTGSVIEAMAGVWPASSLNNPNTLPMTATRSITTTVKGGFDSEFSSQSSGTTVIKGRVNLRSGKTIFNNIKIRP